MIKLKHISAVILLAAASVAHAQTTTPPLPGDQGLVSVNRNLDKNPENQGLQNASEQLKQNQIRHAEQQEKRIEKREAHREHKADRMETRAQRRDTMTRPAKVERPGK